MARGYPEKVVNDQIDKVVFGKNPPVKKSSENGVPFVATSHSKVKDLVKLIKDLLPFLYSDEEFEKVFSLPPIASYRSARKITKDYIARSKLYPVERSLGCRRCGGFRGHVCENIKVTGTFTSFTTKNTYKINQSFDCNDKCQIYLFNCKTCGKQYTGKTTDHFRSRWYNYKSEARKAKSGNMEKVKQKFLQSHFLQPDHKSFLKDVEDRLIDKYRFLTRPRQNFTR